MQEVIKSYACRSRDDEVRLESSSGAVFSVLANYIFNVGGVVYGVTMSADCYSAEFISVSDNNGLKKLRGSKYLQAKVGNTYNQIKQDLLMGRWVLFTGTGCQINGLKTFLRKEYDRLLCVDVICHGVPSPELWRRYVQYQEKRNGAKLKKVNFRCKDNSWTDFGMKENEVYISKNIDSYMQMFLRDYCLRPSCYECVIKENKMSDMTIADFWGINKVVPELNDGKGTSLVLVRTKKGQDIFLKVSQYMDVQEVSYQAGVKENPAEYRSAKKPYQRETFFKDMSSMPFEELEKKYIVPLKSSFTQKIKEKIKSILKVIKIRGDNNNIRYGIHLIFSDKIREVDMD